MRQHHKLLFELQTCNMTHLVAKILSKIQGIRLLFCTYLKPNPTLTCRQLQNIDFELRKGEFVYFIGKVGSGKSSLLKTFYADVPVMDGEARVFDYDMTSIRKRDIPYLRRKIGIVFQDFQLLTDRSVQSNLEFVLKTAKTRLKK